MSIRIEPFMTDRLGLTGAELVVYAAIWSAGPGGAEFSTSMLAHACGISLETASRTRAALEGRGLIRNILSAFAPCDDAVYGKIDAMREDNLQDVTRNV